MRKVIICVLVIGLISCHDNWVGQTSSNENTLVKHNTDKKQKKESKKEQKTTNQKIILSENKIDTFAIPFQEKDMLIDLENYYTSYNVETKIGQQDGPDYLYIDLMKKDDNSVAHFTFDDENKYKLDEIRILDSIVTDEYGIRVGDSYQQIIDKRTAIFKNSTNYHQHTYLYTENSNIYYELGNLTLPRDMMGNIEELVLTEEQLQESNVERIIWRNINQ